MKIKELIGKKVIIRTYSAGCWFGTLEDKKRNEVILEDARRLWKWFAAEGISLSGVARAGLVHDKSKVCAPVKAVWLEAIEIIPCTQEAITSIESAPHAAPRYPMPPRR